MYLYSLIFMYLSCSWVSAFTTASNTGTDLLSTEKCTSTTVSSSLTYVVDTTGSMSDDLAQLKLINSWVLDRVSDRLPCGVRQYTMVEFNDPTIGPVRITPSKSEFGDYFNNLNAYGGGDCPELAMGGLELALDASPGNSVILVLTDASAKDYDDIDLINRIKGLISSKRSQVYFLITGLCSGVNAPDFLIYREIASQSFGHVFKVDLNDMGKVFYYVDFTLSRPVNTTTRLFSRYFDDGTHTNQFNVDNNFTSLIVTTDGVISYIKLSGPDGADRATKVVVSEIWGSVHLVKDPEEGLWTITVTGTGPHAVNVEGAEVTNTSATADCSNCDSNASCDESFDRKECTCNDGFIGDGFTCSDINECAYSWSNNCSSSGSSYCQNTVGSYICVCTSGFVKNSEDACVDIDECSDPAQNSCHPLASCSNRQGGYSCSCLPGYYGDGYRCELDECTTGICGEHNDCVKYNGGYDCFDPCWRYRARDEPWRSTSNAIGYNCDYFTNDWLRFIGSGGIRLADTCVPENSCTTQYPIWINGSHPSLSEGIVNATACTHAYGDCCYRSNLIRVKACPGGYHVYLLKGAQYCYSAYCTDPKSLDDVCNCTPDEECRYVDGNYSCYCRNGRGVSDIQDLNVDLTCGTKEITASFRKCQLSRLNLNVSHLHLRNSNCVGTEEKNGGVISVKTPLNEGICGSVLYTNGTHANYTNTMYVHLTTDEIIIRHYTVQLQFSCLYPLNVQVSMNNSLRPVISATNVTIEGVGQFKAQMLLYRDGNFSASHHDYQVTLSTTANLYAGVILEGENTAQYVVLMKTCFATPTSDFNDPVKYYIIQNSCPNTRDGTVRVQQNGVSTQGYFSVQMFKFVGNYSLVYLHCEVNICDTAREWCRPSCSGARSGGSYGGHDVVLNCGPIVRSVTDNSYSSHATGVCISWTLMIILTALCLKQNK